MRLLYVVCALICVCTLLPAVDTRTWKLDSMEDFDQGILRHLSLSSDGRLSVAPRLREIFDSSTAVLWSVARDSKGNIYAGGGSLGGSRAKLFAIDARGQGKLLAELDGIGVQAIALDRQDRVYAATSPDGKVYRVDSSGKVDVFYDPKAKYIWALAFAKNGDLYVATRRGKSPLAELGYFLAGSTASPVDSAAMKASCGTSTRPTIFIRFLPSFCFSSSLRLRVMSPP